MEVIRKYENCFEDLRIGDIFRFCYNPDRAFLKISNKEYQDNYGIETKIATGFTVIKEPELILIKDVKPGQIFRIFPLGEKIFLMGEDNLAITLDNGMTLDFSKETDILKVKVLEEPIVEVIE